MNWQVIALQFVTPDLGKSNWTFELGTKETPDSFLSMNCWVCISVHGRSVIITQQLAIFNSAYVHQIWPSDLFSCNRYMYAFKSVGMQSFFSCNIKYPFKASVLILIVSGLCALLFYVLKDGQRAPTEHVRFRERDRRINMAPVKHQHSDDSSLEPKTVKQARVSSPTSMSIQHKHPAQSQLLRGSGSERGNREREGDTSAASKSCDVEAAPPLPPHEDKRGIKRSPSGSSLSDDSLSPRPVKVNYRRTKRHGF